MNGAIRDKLTKMRGTAQDAAFSNPGSAAFWNGYDMALRDAMLVLDQHAEPDANGHRLAVIAGSPVTGFRLYGPFTQWNDAQAWGERNAPNAEFWIADLLDTVPEPGLKLAYKKED